MNGTGRRSLVALALLTLLVAPRPVTAQGAVLWLQNLDGTANSFDQALSVAVDHQGNVVAVGSTTNTDTASDFTVSKFDRHGTLLWQQNINGTANGFDLAIDVAVDQRGNVVAAGSTQNAGTGTDFTVVKFDSDGTPLWQQTLSGTAAGSIDQATSIAVDRQGNVLAVGSLQNTGTHSDFTVIKIAGDGTVLWQQMLNGSTTGSSDGAWSVALDHQGNAIVAGNTQNAVLGADFTVASFGSDGSLLWQQTLDGTFSGSADQAFAVAVDHQGNAVAAGFTTNTETGSDFTVAKFARDGSVLWVRTLVGDNSIGRAGDQALAVAMDNQGNAVAAGVTVNEGTGQNFVVAKFAGDGTLAWQQNIDGSAHSDDRARAVAIDHEGNAVVGGVTSNGGTTRDFTVAQFARDGALMWQRDFNGTASGSDSASSVAIDNQGQVAAAGSLMNIDTASDFSVAKLSR